MSPQRRGVAGTADAHPRWQLRKPGPVEPRFWSKVEKTDSCWVWKGGRRRKGYGVFHVLSRPVAAHRFSWELASGQKVPEGFHVLHRCDNPPCVNPAHLFVGSNADNMADAVEKGRHSSLHQRGRRRRLSPEDVLEIRKRYGLGGLSHNDLAAAYGVSRTTIADVLKGAA